MIGPSLFEDPPFAFLVNKCLFHFGRSPYPLASDVLEVF